jgi:hypothetical protein
VFSVKVPRTKPVTPRDFVPVNDEVVVDGMVDEGLTSAAAREQVYSVHGYEWL